MQKNPQTRLDIFWILQIFITFYGSKVQVAHPHGYFSNGISPLTVKSSIKFQKVFQLPPSLRSFYFDSPNFKGP